MKKIKHTGAVPSVRSPVSDRANAAIKLAELVGVAVGSKPAPVANPKDAIGSSKLPLHLWPMTATAMGCLGLLDGALKYGRSNFRVAGKIRASIYVDAAQRHLARWFEGEDIDPVGDPENPTGSGLPHLAHVLACIAILVEAQTAGTLVDDRQVKGGFHELLAELTPHVGRLQALHASKNPKHYTIADSQVPRDHAEG